MSHGTELRALGVNPVCSPLGVLSQEMVAVKSENKDIKLWKKGKTI